MPRSENFPLRTVLLSCALTVVIWRPAAAATQVHPGCETSDAKACVAAAMAAMGGQQTLEALSSAQLELIDQTALVEQSYRQAPFITSYDRVTQTVDFKTDRVGADFRSWWPEADPDMASAESTGKLVATPTGAIIRGDKADTPGPLSAIDAAAARLALGPERLLLTAWSANDLHYAADETIRGTPHTTVAFTWNGVPVRVLLNPFNHLPDAMESTRTFNDFWFAWGDVRQRVYFDNWKLIARVVYPTNWVEERNDIPWKSTQVLAAKFNLPIDPAALAMDSDAATKSAAGKGWNRPFDGAAPVMLAPGVDFYAGAWNVTVIEQPDGLVILEAPISPAFTSAVLAKARADHPGVPVKAVLSSSDSWPHMAGVREAVAQKLPVYILDLNRPLLERLVAAPHSRKPDDLETHPQAADWRIVSGTQALGAGPNRIVLYPIRGASTERQYMVYLPERRLLYASDTLVIDQDKHALYDPELMREVAQAVARENLAVDTVFAMHEGPTPWSEVKRLLSSS
jgi:hypothetical protein